MKGSSSGKQQTPRLVASFPGTHTGLPLLLSACLWDLCPAWRLTACCLQATLRSARGFNRCSRWPPLSRGCSRHGGRRGRHGNHHGSLRLWEGSHQEGHRSHRAWEERRSLRRGHHVREGRRDHRVRHGSCRGGSFAWGRPVGSIVSQLLSNTQHIFYCIPSSSCS